MLRGGRPAPTAWPHCMRLRRRTRIAQWARPAVGSHARSGAVTDWWRDQEWARGARRERCPFFSSLRTLVQRRRASAAGETGVWRRSLIAALAQLSRSAAPGLKGALYVLPGASDGRAGGAAGARGRRRDVTLPTCISSLLRAASGFARRGWRQEGASGPRAVVGDSAQPLLALLESVRAGDHLRRACAGPAPEARRARC